MEDRLAEPLFGDRASEPSPASVAQALGPAADRWLAVQAALAAAFGAPTATWAWSGRAYGWTLRVSLGKRPLAYLTPLSGRFRVSLALPERLVDAAIAAGFPQRVCEVIQSAPAYPEGCAIRLVVEDDADIGIVAELVHIRLSSG